MQQLVNIGKLKRDNILKGFINRDEDTLEKAKSGVYADDAENRKLNRVGQQYGSKKQEESPKGKEGKQEDEGEAKTSLEDHAKNTDSEVLKKVVANEKSSPELVAAAKRELTSRGESHAHNEPGKEDDKSKIEQNKKADSSESSKRTDGKSEQSKDKISKLENDIKEKKEDIKNALKNEDYSKIIKKYINLLPGYGEYAGEDLTTKDDLTIGQIRDDRKYSNGNKITEVRYFDDADGGYRWLNSYQSGKILLSRVEHEIKKQQKEIKDLKKEDKKDA